LDKTHKIKDLEQVRLLADPLKLRLLQAFSEGEKTTKAVARELGESVTKLYRHVDALHDAGLLEIVRETQKRGTVERTFRAVARRFEADRSLFSSSSPDDANNPVSDLMRVGEDELLAALADSNSTDDDVILARFRIKATPEHIAGLRQSLTDWVNDVQSSAFGDDSDDEDLEEAGAIIAFYPVTRTDPSSR
jgi:DNA-binding transcriptional ArsR family regulator